jgi:5'-deoxynucleotidase YfbR-like HD superfamily hydrolase
MLIWHLYPDQFRRMAIFALCHDVAECLVGDMPSTAKESSGVNQTEDAILEEFGLPQLSMLGPKEHALLKVCDRLELYIWAKEQLGMGNTFAQEIVDNLNETFKNYNWNGVEQAKFVYEYLLHMTAVTNRAGLLRRIKEAHAITE